MPELPETETIARDLDHEIKGRRILGALVLRPDVVRGASPDTLDTRLAGSRISAVGRRAKMVVFLLDNGDRIAVQPRFTGALLLVPRADAERTHYATVILALDEPRSLVYADTRRLGTFAVLTGNEFAHYSRRFGEEPLDPSFTTERLSGILRASRRPVKAVLMDQSQIAGIGNIYANEALWAAEIDPSRVACSLDDAAADRLHDSIVTVLRAAIAARGTTFRDFRDAYGARGSFVKQLAAYGRGGHPCPRCGTRLVTTHAIDGRATVFCFRCQR